MSSETIDNKIVRLEFDNAKFEKNVKQSLNTLDKLKKAVDFDKQNKALKEMQETAKHFSIDDIGKSLERVEHQFSGFGIAGMTVMSELTKAAMNTGKKMLSALTAPFEQMKTGGWSRAMNIKDAEFSMKGLGIMGDKLEKIKDDINYAVSGTAYGYDAAAKAAAQFAASNVKIGEDMKTALRSVSGVAAQTNSSYEDIAGIFTTVAANGKLMTQQLRQLSFRGLNASATLAKSLGTSEAAIADLVKKGEIDFNTFATAMDEAFGEHATAANETFTGALNNMKAALSRIGANFADPIIDAERDVFNRLRDLINSLNFSASDVKPEFVTEFQDWVIEEAGAAKRLSEDVLPVIESVRDHFTTFLEDPELFSALNIFVEGLRNVFAFLTQVGQVAVTAFRQVFTVSEALRLREMAESFWEFTDSLYMSEGAAADLQAVFRGLFSALNILRKAVSAVTTVVRVVAGPVIRVALKVFGLLGDAIAEVDYYLNIIEATVSYCVDYFRDLAGVGERVNDTFTLMDYVFDGLRFVLAKISNVVRNVFVITLGLLATAAESLAVAMVAVYAAIEPVVDSLGGLFDAIGGQILGALDTLGMSFDKAGISIDSFLIPLNYLFEIIKTSGLVAVTLLVSAIDSLSYAIENFTGLKDTVEYVANEGFGATKDALEDVGEELGSVASSTETTENALTFLSKKIKYVFTVVKDIIGDVIEKIGDFLSQITPARVAALALVGVLAGIALAIGKILFGIGNFAYQMGNLTKAFTAFTKAVTMRLNPLANARSTIEQIALSILMIAAAMLVIATIDEKRFVRSAQTIAAIAVVIGAALVGITQLARIIHQQQLEQEFNQIIFGMVGISAVLIALSIAFKALAKIEVENLWPKVGAMALLIAELGAVFAAMIAFMGTNGGNMSGAVIGAALLIAFAMGLKNVVKAFKSIEGLDPIKAIESIVAVVLTLGTLLFISKHTLKPQDALGLIAVVVALQFALGVFKKIASADYSAIIDGITNYVGAIAGFIVVFALFLQFASPYILMITKSLAAMLIAFSVGVVALSLAAQIAGSLDGEAFQRATGFVMMAMTMFIALSLVFKFVQDTCKPMEMGVMFMAVAVAINLLISAVYLLGNIKQSTLNKGLGALAIITAMFALLEYCAGFTASISANSFKTIMSIAISLVLIAGTLVVLSMVDWKDLYRSVGAMGLVMFGFAAVIRTTTKGFGYIKPTDVTLIAVIAAGLIGVAIYLDKLAKHDWKKTLAAGVSMALTFAAFAFAIEVLNKIAQMAAQTMSWGAIFKQLVSSLGIVLVAAVLMWSVGSALQMICDYDWQSILAAGAAMAGCMLVVAVVAGIATLIGKVSGAFVAALQGIGIMIAVVALLGLFAWGVGQLLNTFDKEGVTEKAIERFGNIMYLVGESFGKLIAGFVGGTLAFIPVVGEYLGDFWDTSEPFWTGMKENLTPDLLNCVQIFSTLITNLALIDFANGLNPLKNLMDTIQSITGTNSMDKFGEMFASLGDAMRAFKENVKDFSTKDLKRIKLAAEAANLIVEINNKIPRQDQLKEGGVYSLATAFSGDVSLATFSENIKLFGKALVNFSNAVSAEGAIDYDACKLALRLGKKIAKFAEEDIGTHGGFISKFTGDNDFAKFSTNIKLFGKAIANFSDKCQSLVPANVKKCQTAVNIGKGLAQMAKDIPNTGGFISFFTGDKKFDDFSNNLPVFAKGIAGFCKEIAGIPDSQFANVDAASEAGMALAKLAQQIPNQNDWSGKGSLKKLGESMGEFAKACSEGLKDFEAESTLKNKISNFERYVNQILNIQDTITKKQSNAFIDLADNMKRLTAYADSDYGGLTIMSEQTFTNTQTALDNSLGAISQKYLDFYERGKDALAEFAKGLSSNQSVVKCTDAVRSIVNKLLSNEDVGLKSAKMKAKFEDAGKYCIDGFLLGLKNKDKLKAVHEAGANLGEEANKGLKEKEKVKSPSKVFIQNGQYIGEGLVIGLQSYYDKVKKAGAKTGEAAEEGIRTSLGIHSPSWVTELLGKFTASGFYKGLMEKISQIKRAGENIGETLFNKIKEVAGPEAMEALGIDSMDGLTEGLGDVGKTGGGGGGKGGSGSAAEKWTKKDQEETLLYLMGIFQTASKKYDAFNKNLIKNGKITKDYLIKSFKDKGLRAAAEQFAPNLIKDINKSIKKNTKGLKGKALFKEIKKITKGYISDIEEEYSQLQGMIKKMAGDGAVANLTSPNFRKGIAKFIKSYDSAFKVVKKNIKNTMEDLGISEEAATKRYEYFGDYLYKKSDQYKQDKKQLKSYNTEYKKLIKQAEKYRKIIKDPTASAEKKKSAKQQLSSIYSEMTKLDENVAKLFSQMAKHRQKALKQFKKDLKETLKEFTSIKNIDFSGVFSGFSKFSEQTQLAQEACGSAMDAITASTTKATSNLTEAFDVMSASMDTGINLLEKFTKTGTAEVDALLERADGQLKGYEEFQSGLEKLEQMGLAQSVIDDLESQGPSALNYIRGFMNMSEDQIKQYNAKVAKKEQYESKTLQRSLDKQKRQYEEWASDISSLLGKIPDKLMEKLKDAGTSGAQFVHALTKMDANELKKFGDLYSSSLISSISSSLSTITSTGTAVNAINIDYFIKNLEDNSKALAKWRADLATIKSKVAPKLYEAIQSMGVDNRTLLDAILNATEEQLKKYNDLYVEYADSMSKGSLKTMAENIMSNVNAARDWQMWLDVMRKEDPRAYKELSSMGFDNGYEYGKAWYTAYIDGDEEARKEFSDALAEKDRVTFENATRDILDKRGIEQQYAKDMDDIANYIANVASSYGTDSDIYKSLKSLYESFLEGGLEGADKVHAIVDQFRRAFGVDNMEGTAADFDIWTQFIEGLMGTSTDAASVTDSVTQSYEKVIAEGANQAAKSDSVLQASVKLGDSVGKGAKKEVKKSTKKAITEGVKEGTKSAKKSAKSQGTVIGKNIGSGIESEASVSKVTSSSKKLGSTAISTLKTYCNSSKGKSMGKNVGSGISKGLDSMLDSVKKSCSDIAAQITSLADTCEAEARRAQAALEAARAAAAAAASVSYSSSPVVQEASSTGKAVGEGIASGISSTTKKVSEAAHSVAQNLVSKIREKLKVNSPSKVTMEIGKYVVEGFAIGIEDNLHLLNKPVDDFTNIVTSIADSLDTEDLSEPVIRPTLDLSDVTAKARELNNIIQSSTDDIKLSADGKNDETKTNGSMTFIQNNYSPKALDRLELYRQTRNQFANAKGLVMA